MIVYKVGERELVGEISRVRSGKKGQKKAVPAGVLDRVVWGAQGG